MRKPDKIIGILSILLLLASMFSLVYASTVEYLQVGGGQIETVPIRLLSPQTVTGSLKIYGTELNDTVDFWVSNPKGATILDSETSANGTNFIFTSSSDGKYVLNFKNHLSYNETIDLEYSVSSAPFRILGLDLFTFIGIVIEIVVVLAIVGIVVYKTKAKRKSQQ